MTCEQLMSLLQDQRRNYNREWCEWLLTLTAWELHYVFNRELDWYDDYVAGLVSFEVLHKILAAQFRDSDAHSVAV